MNPTLSKLGLTAALCLSLTFGATAQTDEPIRLGESSPEIGTPQLSDAQRARIEGQMSETRRRLNLSEQQEADLAPIMYESVQQRAALMDKYGITPGGGRPNVGIQQMRSMRNDMTALQQSTNRAVSKVLDKDQMKIWRKIQKERQDEMRSQIRGRRS